MEMFRFWLRIFLKVHLYHVIEKFINSSITYNTRGFIMESLILCLLTYVIGLIVGWLWFGAAAKNAKYKNEREE
jgi:hypothetical protein